MTTENTSGDQTTNTDANATETPTVSYEDFQALMQEVQTLRGVKSTLENETKSLRKEKSTVVATAAAKAGDLESLQNQYNSDLQERDQRIADLEKRYNDGVIKTTLSKAFVDNHVLPAMHEPLSAWLASGVEVVDGVARKDGIPLEHNLKTFFASPVAKDYIAAPINSGGGSTGSTANGSAWTAEKAFADTTEWMKFAGSNREVARSLANAWNEPSLAP